MLSNTNLYDVMLSDAHPGYHQVRLRRRPGYENHVVIFVDIHKLIHFSDQHLHSNYVVPPAKDWSELKRQEVAKFLAPPGPKERHVEMPFVSFNEMQVQFRVPFMKVFSHKRERLVRWVGYTLGRHRTRYLHFAGASVIPVMCLQSEAQTLQHHCGVSA